MAIYNQRVDLTKEELIASSLRRESIWDFIYGIVRFLGIILQNVYCVSSYLVLSWIVFFPLNWVRVDIYSRVENCLYNSLLFIVSSWSMAAGSLIVEAGDEYKHLIEEPELTCPQTVKQTKQLQTQTRNGCHATDRQFALPFKNNVAGDETTTDSQQEPKKDHVTSINHKQLISNGNSNNHNNNNNSINNNNNSNKTKNNNIINTMNFGFSSDLKTDQRKPRILLLCNHISTADVPLMMQSFSTLTNQSLLWVLDAQFKLTNFGVVCSSHGDFFVAKNSFVDGSLRDQVLQHPDRNLLVLFPEGGFLRKRLEGSNRYADRNKLPRTTFVTHPRFGAFKDLMDPSVGVTHIVDATLMYDDMKDPLSILNIGMGNRKEAAILYHKVYDRSEINPTEEWLRNIWLEKDKLLAKYYEDRNSVYKLFEGTLRTAKLDWFKLLAVHLFYLLVCYLTMYRLFSATNILMLTAKDLYYSNI